MKRLDVLTLGLFMLATGCSRDSWQRSPGPDDVVKLVPWFSTMQSDVGIRPYKMPQPMSPVDGTVPVGGADVRFQPIELAPANSAALDSRYPNPAERTAESIERGRDRFSIYCGVCHGERGDAQGPMAQVMPFIPSLLTDRAQAYSDGYLYALIVAGRGLMPAYGDRVRGDDRWHVVNYIRVLQGTN